MFTQSTAPRFVASVGLTLMLLAASAAAGDGVKRIKQPSSFPYTITKPGSYRLTSNITVPDANTTAIRIQTDDVKLDLNGFTIAGPNVCDPFSYSCTTYGNGIGVDAGENVGITVVDGTVRGMGSTGIVMGGGRVQRVRAADNGDYGILVENTTEGGRIEDVIVAHNGGRGIIMSSGVITKSMITNNAGHGIWGIDAGVVTNCHIEGNGGGGIEAGDYGVVIASNNVSVNLGVGIYVAGGGSSVVGNTVVGNSDGIFASESTVIHNTANDNDSFGIQTNGALVANTTVNNDIGIEAQNGGYAHNVTHNNTTTDLSGGTDLGGNLCGVDMTCP